MLRLQLLDMFLVDPNPPRDPNPFYKQRRHFDPNVASPQSHCQYKNIVVALVAGATLSIPLKMKLCAVRVLWLPPSVGSCLSNTVPTDTLVGV